MPNYVTNIVSFSGEPKVLKEMLEKIKDGELGTISFDKIAPMPKGLDIESGSMTIGALKIIKDFINSYTDGCETVEKFESIDVEVENEFLNDNPTVTREQFDFGKQYYKNILMYGAPTWYEWCWDNWGTKWDAIDSYGSYIEGAKDIEMSFDTAWSPPLPIFEKLAKMYPSLTLEAKWADEDIGNNCGSIKYENGELVEKYEPESYEEGFEFACEILGVEPEEREEMRLE